MSNKFAKSFRELIVYRKAQEVASLIFERSREFPPEERYSLTDQIRRSSRSIGAQIAEAWAKRRYPRHFTSKLTDAEGETNETSHWLQVAFECGYLSAEEATRAQMLLIEIGRMLGSMIRQAESFDGSADHELREYEEPYGFPEELPPTEH